MENKIILKNVMEELVESKLNEMMTLSNMCCCERCRADVAALALNQLPPRYVVTDSGSVFARFELLATAQMQISVTTEIQCAIELVSQRPRHEKQVGSV